MLSDRSIGFYVKSTDIVTLPSKLRFLSLTRPAPLTIPDALYSIHIPILILRKMRTMPTPFEQNLPNIPPQLPRLVGVTFHIGPQTHPILLGIKVTHSPSHFLFPNLSQFLFPAWRHCVPIQHRPSLQTGRVLITARNPRVQQYQNTMASQCAQEPRCQVLGKRENHGVIAAPVRTFGGTTVAEETCQREWCLGASVEDYEELSGSVGAPVGEHVKEDLRGELV